MAKVPLCHCKCCKLLLHFFALLQAATDCRYQLFLSMQLLRKPAAISYVAVPLLLPHMVLTSPSTEVKKTCTAFRPPLGTDVPTFADPCRGASIQAEVGLHCSSMSAYTRPAHIGRSRLTVVCLSWLTLADLSLPILEHQLQQGLADGSAKVGMVCLHICLLGSGRPVPTGGSECSDALTAVNNVIGRREPAVTGQFSINTV
jgi:hypothetical protein